MLQKYQQKILRSKYLQAILGNSILAIVKIYSKKKTPQELEFNEDQAFENSSN